MDRKRLQELIQADLDGELSHAERAELARVLLQDHDARRLQHEFRRTHELLRGIPAAETPAGLRAEILAVREQVAHPPAPAPAPAQRKYNPTYYRVAAVLLAGVLVVGVSEILRDRGPATENLQGSLRAALQDHLSLRAENVEVRASLTRVGAKFRLELNSTGTIATEVIARIDPQTATFIGNSGDANLAAANGQVAVQLSAGSQFAALEFSGASPIQIELRADGRLLAEGRLSTSD